MELLLTILRGELKEAVTGFSKIIGGRSTLPILGCVRFEKTVSGIVAQVTNLDETAQYRFAKADALGEGAFIVPLASLKELTKGKDQELITFATSDSITITVTNNIEAHTVRLPLSGMDLGLWPLCPTEAVTALSEGFLETYRRLLPFTSTDPTRTVFSLTKCGNWLI